ncbi:MAG: Wzz/FepE/Etk N-terminal domain-containing protein, partial [Rubrobacteraceae bacterium]
MRSTSRQGWQREERDHLTLREVLHVLWVHRVLVMVVMLGFVLASVVFSMLQDTVYEAEAVVV